MRGFNTAPYEVKGSAEEKMLKEFQLLTKPKRGIVLQTTVKALKEFDGLNKKAMDQYVMFVDAVEHLQHERDALQKAQEGIAE